MPAESTKVLLTYSETPVQEINHTLLEEAGVRLLIKREDLNHPFISGNKWWKLKYNLAEAVQQNRDTVLTFGGAYSNHLYATAAAAQELGFKSIAIVRGEETLPLNPTLQFVKEKGMVLHYVSREIYRAKTKEKFLHQLQQEIGDFYLIPEGGTNELAVKGCAEFAATFSSIDFDCVCLPVGTGGTLAGVIKGMKGKGEVIGFPVLKGGEFLREEILTLEESTSDFLNWTLMTDYHFGGYAKATPSLINFIKDIDNKCSIPLDQVYTGKMIWGIFDLVQKGYFKKGTTVLAIHTGGLQGRSF